MWIRKIGASNTASTIVLPAQMMRELGWRRGDHLSIAVVGEGTVVLQKVAPEKLTDAQIAAATPEPTIEYE